MYVCMYVFIENTITHLLTYLLNNTGVIQMVKPKAVYACERSQEVCIHTYIHTCIHTYLRTSILSDCFMILPKRMATKWEYIT